MAKCKSCRGTGIVIRSINGYPCYSDTCSKCHGTGRGRKDRCPTCDGVGKVNTIVCGYLNLEVICPSCHGRKLR